MYANCHFVDPVNKTVNLVNKTAGVDNFSTKFAYKNLSFFDPSNLIKPLTDKITEILAVNKHPNYGGVQFLSPQYLWERLHEKGHPSLSGPHGAIFGVAHKPVQGDYPFPYRK